MLFNSYIFILIFFPLVLLGWFALNRLRFYSVAKFFLISMSLWFYGYYNTYYLAVIICSLLLNYLTSFLLKYADTRLKQRLGLVAGIMLNLGLLFYFKYYDFFFENINALFHTGFSMKNILLPLGISFFTFQQLSYIIDRSLNRCKHYNFLDFALFVTFFPQLIAGPIVLHSEIIPQFNNPENLKFNSSLFSKGIVLFTIGLAKKVLLADILALPVNFGFEQTAFMDSISTLLVLLAYTFEIYFDFSGYCDMAMGIGLMFNITLPVNFNSPYKACTVKELWQRWHITLSRFFITYVYIPLGGSKKGKIRTVINTLLVFFLSGLWHGANWTFVAWGTMQGLLVVWDNLHLIGVKGSIEKKPSRFLVPKWLGWFLTFSFFNLSLIFFRSDNMSNAFLMFKNLFSFHNTGYLYKVAAKMDIPEFYLIKQALNMFKPQYLNIAYIIVFLVLLIISAWVLTRKNSLEIANSKALTKPFTLWLIIIFVWCVISFSQVSTFIYFNF